MITPLALRKPSLSPVQRAALVVLAALAVATGGALTSLGAHRAEAAQRMWCKDVYPDGGSSGWYRCWV